MISVEEFLLLIVLILFIFFLLFFYYYYSKMYCKIINKVNKYRKGYGYIYFYRGKGELSNLPLVKIGRTNNMIQRMKAAKTSNPYGIELLAVCIVKNDVFAESYIHNKFRRYRINKNNEWFWYIPVMFFMYCVRDKKLTKLIKGKI